MWIKNNKLEDHTFLLEMSLQGLIFIKSSLSNDVFPKNMSFLTNEERYWWSTILVSPIWSKADPLIWKTSFLEKVLDTGPNNPNLENFEIYVNYTSLENMWKCNEIIIDDVSAYDGHENSKKWWHRITICCWSTTSIWLAKMRRDNLGWTWSLANVVCSD